jgi:hypothetical protein
MTKVVYNGCYGGFGLSAAALRRYAEIKGWQYREGSSQSNWSSGSVIDLQGEELSEYDIGANRTDPVLVQVVEELGDRANGMCADLVVEDLPAGTRYRIDEYDGLEHIETEIDIIWQVA